MPPKRKKNAEDEETPRSNRRVRNGSEATRAEAGNQDMDDQEQAEQPRPSKKQASKRPVQDPDQDFDEHDEDGMEVEEEEGGLRIGDIYIPPPPAPALTFEANGPRLIITHITNENFKSYAGKEILGPFHKSFTSIVGPNGSGKSNVIDSMLFVFGYRANKIRSKKISVLLHNSAKFPNVQSCTVSVHFQLIIDKPGDDFEVVPNSRFVISRTAFKDNKSFYEIDGRRVQFKEVAKLLKHHGIDLIHNRFLILQGEVEQIAMMKPKAPTEHDVGMLEYLEDIVGSSRYKEPIEMLQQRVEALNEQRTEKLNRVKLVEKEKDDLQGPRDKAVAYIECENKVTENKHIQQQIYKFDAQKDLENAEEEKKAFEEEMAEITNKLGNVADRKLTKTKEYDEIATLRRKAAAKVEKANEEFKQLATEDDRINEMIKIAKENRTKLKKSLATETKKWEECQGAPEKHRIEIEKLEELKVELEQKRTEEEEAVAKILASLSKETESLQKDKDKLEEQLLELKKTVNETQSAFNIAQSELDIYLSKENHEKATLEKMQETYTGAKQTVEECQKNIAYWEKEGPKKQTLLTKTQSDLDNLAKEEGFLDEEIRRVRSQLEEGRSLMAANHSRGRVLDSLMDQKKSGKILGIFGRLGDLGGINEKYDIAISTACGPLDNIVVDTVDTAQQCVLFLRKNNLGLASFIALDKMERWRDNANSKIQTPENVNRLYDLIDIRDERVKTAFYYAIRDTLVANDLEQATRIAYGQVRHRVVTLRGDMIEPSGTMSGGGKSVSRGRMGRQVRTDTSGNGLSADELKTMEGRMNSYVEKMQHLREKKTELQRQVATVTQELKESQIEKWTMEIKALKEKASTIEGQLKAQEKQVKDAKPDQNKVKTLEAAIAAKRKNFDEATSAAAKVEEKVQKVRDQIEAIAGRRVKAAQEKLETVVKQLDKTAGDISRLSVAIKTAERNAKKSADKIESLKQELEEIQEEMSVNSKRLDEIEKICSPLLEKTEEYKKELAEAEEQAVEIKKELDGIVQDEKKIKAAKIEFDQKVQKITDRVAHSKSRIAHAEREMGKLKFQHIDGEDMREFRVLSVDELETLDRDKLKYAVELGEQDLRAQKPNLAVIEEYRKKEEAYVARVAELDEVTKSRDEQREHVDNLSKARLNEFMAGFGIITMKLKEMYQMITMGGDAELELLDSLDPFTEGIVFSVRPPKKSWKNISNLSGGEKTLSSLALVFALHYYKPTPLYVMDEIDAALDYKNVSIVGHYIKERTKNAQFIVISLRSNMFELADRLVGIYKVLNCTHSVTINPAYYGDGQVNSEEKSKSVGENRETTFDLVRNNTENGQIREPEERNVTEEE